MPLHGENMKWIMDENLGYHNLDKIRRITLNLRQVMGSEDFFEIKAYDDKFQESFIIQTLFLNIDEAQAYFITKMEKEFGKENIHFLEE